MSLSYQLIEKVWSHEGQVKDLYSEPLLDLLTDFITLVTPDFDIVKSNRSANIVFGKGDSVTGSKCYEIFRDASEPCTDCPLSETLENGVITPVFSFDERLGEYLEERTHPVVSDSGDLLGFILVCRNETKAREMAEERAKDKKLAAIGQISSGVAHDFNNVLAGILGRVQILQKQVKDKELIKDLQVIERAAQDGAATVRRMQDFTRARKDVVFEPIDLKTMIEDVVAISQPKWRETTERMGSLIEMITDLSDGLKIMGNISDLRNAFTNMIFNAVDAMPDGGVLTISSKEEDHSAILYFRDTGIGMTDEIKERVYDPFFSTKGVKGNGLGLTEVYGVVKRHEGSIELESEVGKGTQFTFHFPLTEEVEVKKVEEKVTKFVASRILAVDDEEYVLEAIKDILTESGHEVVGFTSAMEGINAFKENTFDIVITDLGMSEMSGQELAEKIKKINPKIPIVLLSGWVVNLEEEKDLGAVIDIALTKPFTIESITEAVNKAVILSKESNAEMVKST